MTASGAGTSLPRHLLGQGWGVGGEDDTPHLSPQKSWHCGGEGVGVESLPPLPTAWEPHSASLEESLTSLPCDIAHRPCIRFT